MARGVQGDLRRQAQGPPGAILARERDRAMQGQRLPRAPPAREHVNGRPEEGPSEGATGATACRSRRTRRGRTSVQRREEAPRRVEAGGEAGEETQRAGRGLNAKPAAPAPPAA